MIQESLINTFLGKLCEIYRSEHGSSRAMLSEWCFSYTVAVEHDSLLQIIKNAFSEGDFADGLKLIFQEMVERGYLHENPDASYQITAQGYAHGTQSRSSKFISFFNLNPGLNTLISVLSLVIALAALYFSTSKP